MSGEAIVGFILLLVGSFVLGLLKAIPVIIAGQVANAKNVNYFKAVALFGLAYGLVSVYITISGSFYLANLAFMGFDVGICLLVMVLLVKPYGFQSTKDKVVFFMVGVLLNIILMVGLFYLIFNGSSSILPTAAQG